MRSIILQFPRGSTFAWDFTAADRDEIMEIVDFLRSHSYRVGGTHEWTFVHPDP